MSDYSRQFRSEKAEYLGLFFFHLMTIQIQEKHNVYCLNTYAKSYHKIVITSPISCTKFHFSLEPTAEYTQFTCGNANGKHAPANRIVCMQNKYCMLDSITLCAKGYHQIVRKITKNFGKISLFHFHYTHVELRQEAPAKCTNAKWEAPAYCT